MIRQVFLLLLFFLSGFARIEDTKIFGVQAFVIVAIIFLSLSYLFNRSTIKPLEKGTSAYSYKLFLLWSIPALAIGLYFSAYDALYFYLYTVLPLLLYISTRGFAYNFKRFLFSSEISLFIVTCIGWAIYLGLVPINFLFDNVPEAEINLRYWGISYLPSTRNHDYMYPMVGCAFALYFWSNESVQIRRVFHLVCFIFFEITIIASLARGGMIIAIINFFLFISRLNIKGKLVSSFFAIILFFLFYGPLMGLINSIFANIFLSIFGLSTETHYGANFSNNMRQRIYYDAIVAGINNPIGYGIQNFKITSNFNGGSAENAYLTVLVERGWCAVIFFISFLIKAWKETLQIVSRNTLNFYLIPAIAVYFLFNYEFTSYMCVFVFYLILISNEKYEEQN